MVSGSNLKSAGCGFKSRSDHYLDLFHGSSEFKSSATLVNTQLVCLRPVGILNNVNFNLNCLFSVVCSAPLAFVLKHSRGLITHINCFRYNIEMNQYLLRGDQLACAPCNMPPMRTHEGASPARRPLVYADLYSASFAYSWINWES